MKRSRSGCSIIVWLLLAVFGLLALGLAFNTLTAIPQKAQTLFGPPSQHLSASQRFLLSYRLLGAQDLLLTPSRTNDIPVEFDIEPDESVDSILSRLQASGLISDTEAARNYLVYTGMDTRIQSGNFTLNQSASPIQNLSALMDSTPREATLVILAGWRLEEIAASLPTSGLEISPQEFIAAANTHGYTASVVQFIPAGASLEGFFPPGSYQVDRTLNATELVGFLLDRFDQSLPYDIRTGFESQGLTLYQAVTLASIIQREAVVEEEMPVIASVFYNRLAIGMNLETDPTVQYALGYNTAKSTWWTNPLSLTDLQVDSPYNTYLHPGLPPGPISAPSLEALRAVAFPAVTPYYYFRAACDGSGRHNFSQSFEEHLSNACP